MEKFKIIRTLTELEALRAYLEDKEYIAFDSETTGLTKEDHIIGFSCCADVEGPAFYVILREWNVEAKSLRTLETLSGAEGFFQSLMGKPLVMHNAVFDCSMVEYGFGVKLMSSVHTDSMILAHLLDENRRVGLKELAVSIYGEDSKKEQEEMKASISRNGGSLTKDCYELYKGDSELIGKYGAQDALLTLKLFYHFVPELYEQGLDKFFYEEESMPLLRGPTYELNTVGLRVDAEKLESLKRTLEAECLEHQAFIDKEISSHIKDLYPGTAKKTTFNLGSGTQLAWLLFERLENEFSSLTDSGKDLCKFLDMKVPYNPSAKRNFIYEVKQKKGQLWQPLGLNPKTKQPKKKAKIKDPWAYMSTDIEALSKRVVDKYKWVEALLKLKKNEKLLSTYVSGIQCQMQYNIIRPSFLQHGTTSGRYSSRAPNFQNLPRDDKRIKGCIVARPGKVFVGADYSQLEPRVFASLSKDERLLLGFEEGNDFYSVVGSPTFNVIDCTLKKDDSPDSFPVKYKKLRDVSKIVALAIPYGTTAPQLASEIEKKAGIIKSMDECQEIIDNYFLAYPSVEQLMLDYHEQAKTNGVVYSLFGRPRRIPQALEIKEIYGNSRHRNLPAAVRNILNLAMNHPIQSTGSSIANRAMIKFRSLTDAAGIKDCNIALQVHDEIVAECLEEDAEDVVALLRYAMETVVELPGVDLVAEPKIASNLADLK